MKNADADAMFNYDIFVCILIFLQNITVENKVTQDGKSPDGKSTDKATKRRSRWADKVTQDAEPTDKVKFFVFLFFCLSLCKIHNY